MLHDVVMGSEKKTHRCAAAVRRFGSYKSLAKYHICSAAKNSPPPRRPASTPPALLIPNTHPRPIEHQLEVIHVSPTDTEAKAVEGDRTLFAVGDKGSNATSPSSPSAPGDSPSMAARRRGMACSIVGGSAAIANKGFTTDGREQEPGHPINAQPAKFSSSKVELGL